MLFLTGGRVTFVAVTAQELGDLLLQHPLKDHAHRQAGDVLQRVGKVKVRVTENVVDLGTDTVDG